MSTVKCWSNSAQWEGSVMFLWGSSCLSRLLISADSVMWCSVSVYLLLFFSKPWPISYIEMDIFKSMWFCLFVLFISVEVFSWLSLFHSAWPTKMYIRKDILHWWRTLYLVQMPFSVVQLKLFLWITTLEWLKFESGVKYLLLLFNHQNFLNTLHSVLYTSSQLFIRIRGHIFLHNLVHVHWSVQELGVIVIV